MENLSREAYRTIKQMDKQELTDYLRRVYRRGYDDGKKDRINQPAAVTPGKVGAPKVN